MASKEKFVDCTQVDGIELIINFLKTIGIDAFQKEVDETANFNRTIFFTIYNVEYQIEWYVNQSTLIIGNKNRSARLPFKYIYLDDCFPLVFENLSIGFSYTKNQKQSIFDREFPYENFRIPLEKNFKTGDTIPDK